MQPPTFDPTVSFSDEEASQVGGRSTVRTAALDAILASAAATIEAIRDNLALIQRDDGALVDGIVPMRVLGSDVRALFGNWNPRGAWAAATSYAAKDMVSQGGSAYVAAAAHTSGTFADDLAAGKWIPVSLNSIAGQNVTVSPTGGIAATDAQSALAELDAEFRPGATLYSYITYGGF